MPLSMLLPLQISTVDTSQTDPVLHIFNNSGWEVYQAQNDITTQQTSFSLTLVTYNVWFEDHYFHLRAEGLCGMLPKINGDVLALQEVTTNLLHILVENEYVKQNYLVSDINGATIQPYGVLILVHRRVCEKFKIELDSVALQSGMFRNVRVLSLKTDNGVNITIASTHLESLDNRNLREHQMKQIKELLASRTEAIIMGDFNFDDENNWDPEDDRPIENITLTQIFSDYVDVWPCLRGSGGKTFDTDVNLMVAEIKTEQERMRYDRVLAKL